MLFLVVRSRNASSNSQNQIGIGISASTAEFTSWAQTGSSGTIIG